MPACHAGGRGFESILRDDGLRFLLSHFRLRLQRVVYFMPLSSALLVQCVGTKANLLLKVECGFRHFCWLLMC